MWHLGTWFTDRFGRAGIMVVLNHLGGLFKPKWFYDSVLYPILHGLLQQCMNLFGPIQQPLWVSRVPYRGHFMLQVGNWKEPSASVKPLSITRSEAWKFRWLGLRSGALVSHSWPLGREFRQLGHQNPIAGDFCRATEKSTHCSDCLFKGGDKPGGLIRWDVITVS